MLLLRTLVPFPLRTTLAAALAAGLLMTSTAAGAADSLPTPPEARFATADAGRVDYLVLDPYAGRCDSSRRCGEGYAFAATRGLRHSGINPAVAVVLAPATLVVDAVFFPFALALDNLAD